MSDEQLTQDKKRYTTLPDLGILMTVDEAAKCTGLSKQSIRIACRKGTIKGAALVGSKWRINRDALLEQFGLVEKVG